MLKSKTSRLAVLGAVAVAFLALAAFAPAIANLVFVAGPWVLGVTVAAALAWDWVTSAGVDYDAIAAQQDREHARDL